MYAIEVGLEDNLMLILSCGVEYMLVDINGRFSFKHSSSAGKVTDSVNRVEKPLEIAFVSIVRENLCDCVCESTKVYVCTCFSNLFCCVFCLACLLACLVCDIIM